MERLRKYTTIFYCTHILDDVQRVSDTVAILNHGELVASGPIEDLLAAGEGLAYEVTLEGDVESAYRRATSQPWVTGIKASRRNDYTHWIVAVADGEAAKAQLLRLLLADDGLVVTDFHRKEQELEDVFVRIVEGGQHGSGQ
jgi:ABC-2 type transport system ATP-binding protein